MLVLKTASWLNTNSQHLKHYSVAKDQANKRQWQLARTEPLLLLSAKHSLEVLLLMIGFCSLLVLQGLLYRQNQQSNST